MRKTDSPSFKEKTFLKYSWVYVNEKFGIKKVEYEDIIPGNVKIGDEYVDSVLLT